jgi:hypothetical protein
MPKARHRTTYRFDPSKNEAAADAADWLFGFDESALDAGSVPEKYRKVDGETVVEMTELEKVAVEQPAALAEISNRTRDLALADMDATYDAANGNVAATAKAAVNSATTLAELTAARGIDTR